MDKSFTGCTTNRYFVHLCVCVIDFMWVTCPGQGWIRRTSHDTGHSVALPLRDGHTHTVRSGSHNHAAMLPWDGSHTPHTYSDLERGRSLDRDKHKIKLNYEFDCLCITLLCFLSFFLLCFFLFFLLCFAIAIFYTFKIVSTWWVLKTQLTTAVLCPGCGVSSI